MSFHGNEQKLTQKKNKELPKLPSEKSGWLVMKSASQEAQTARFGTNHRVPSVHRRAS